jgi:hypothetical protein
MDDGTLLSLASRQAARDETATAPEPVSDGMLLTEAALMYQHTQNGRGRDTGESIVSELAAAGTPTAGPSEFDWSDAAAGFGVAAFGATLLAGGAYMVRRRRSLVDIP